MPRAPVSRIVVTASLLLLTGCSSNLKGKLEGTRWSSLGTKIKGIDFTSGTARVEFTREGKVSFRFGSNVFSGTYTLGMGDGITMHFDRELANRKTHYETVVIKGDLLTMTDPDGTKMQFIKD